MKQLPPTLREKERYLEFKIHAEEKVEFEELVEEVWSSSLDYLGSKGSGKANPWIIKNKFDYKSQKGVIKIEREMKDDFRTALTLIQDFNETKGFLSIQKVSGSIKKLQQD